MQLHATLSSFFAHCCDANEICAAVLFKASGLRHLRQYETLMREFPQVAFFAETNFRAQLLALLGGNYLLFLVDDNLFISDFSLVEIAQAIEASPSALGFSLRLGKNTTHCYVFNRPQPLPPFEEVVKTSGGLVQNSVLSFEWPTAQYDFHYPLEVSSSVYRTPMLRQLFAQLPFDNPNTLEGNLAQCMQAFVPHFPNLLCFERSVTFCSPLNKVQEVAPDNRFAEELSLTVERLSDYFDTGKRVDLRSLQGIVPNACHMPWPLRFI